MSKAPAFHGSIPAAYEQYLVPLLFEPYAADLARRAAALAPGAVLETACGTGVVTRALRAALPGSTSIVATDLSDAMLARAREQLAGTPAISFRTADACNLPFPDASVDLVVSQFGLMFFPDRHRGLTEARRVLRPGGRCLISVWGGHETNPVGRLAHQNMLEHFPGETRSFYELPHSMGDPVANEALFAQAGFAAIAVEDVRFTGEAPSARAAALGLVTGTPALAALEERGVSDPAPLVASLTRKLAAYGGDTPFRTPLSALVITARNPG